MLNIKEFQSSNKLFDGRYRILGSLSSDGGAADMWLARDMNTVDENASANDESSGQLVLIKAFRPKTALDIEDEQHWQDEFDAAFDCSHPNLLPPVEYTIFNDIYYLVFPYVKTKALSQLIGKNISEKTTWKLILDIGSGLNELHTHQPQIIHDDIRPSNILTFDDESFALTNYGIHYETDPQRISNAKDEPTNGLAYMAPERFQDNSAPHPESDIWALGATLYEVLAGNKPFGEQGGQNQQADTPIPPLPDQPEEIKNLVYACLQADPKARPTAHQIKDAARSKKFIKAKKQANHTKDSLGKDKGKKKLLILVGAIALLLLSVMAIVLQTNRHDDDSGKGREDVVAVNYYDKMVSLLSEENTAAKGRELLDSLVSLQDWQATFLLSRLYFDPREYDTVFYDKRWGKMRDNYGITPNNKTAHNYLFDAFELKENDFMILYQLGCDYKAGTVRGCDRNLDYALWCFNQAEKHVLNNSRYREELEHGRDRISTDNHSPIKPSR